MNYKWDIEVKGKLHVLNTDLSKIKDTVSYHNDWNWLMKVIGKIENITFNIENEVVSTWVHIMGEGCFIDQRNETITMQPNLPEQILTKLEATFKAVVEFIKWYNLNSKK